MTDEQKTLRYQLENSKTPLTPAEKVLLAALGDLHEANDTGNNLKACQEAAAAAQKQVDSEKGLTTPTTEAALPQVKPGGDAVAKVQKMQHLETPVSQPFNQPVDNQPKPVITKETVKSNR